MSSFSLPLSYTSKTTYTIHYNEKLKDVIEITHRNIPFISDIECGTMMFYQVENINYTTNSLDSVVIVNPDINNEEKRNFNIYYTIRGVAYCYAPYALQPKKRKTATTEEKATVPLYQGTYVGLDVFGLGSKIFGSDFTSAEVSVEVNLKNRFIPIIEIGYGHTDTTDDETNIHYKASAPYFRIGMNYNILFKKPHLPVTRMEVYAMASPLSHTTSMLPQWSTRLGETSPFRLPTMG